MDHPALKELMELIKEPNLEERESFLKEWKDKWMIYTENTQHVVNKSILDSEDTDFVWYKVAEMCALDLIENDISINTTTNNSFSCGIYALRSPVGKLKENKKGNRKAK